MPLAPVVAASLAAGLPSRRKALWVAGLDVLFRPGLTYGVTLEDLELTEAGPGQVSSLTFGLDDPDRLLAPAKGDPVLFQDLTRNLPLFAGWIDTMPYEPLGLGRHYTVTCTGVEALLDWMKVPGPFTFPALSDCYAAVATLIANATGLGVGIRHGHNPAGTSTQALPFILSTPSATLGYDLTIQDATLRDAITQVIQAANAQFIATFGIDVGDFRFTLDWYLGLRSWDLSGQWATDIPDDWTTLTVAGPARWPAGTVLETTGNEVRGVSVRGGNAAGTGVVMDGTGIPGEVAIVSDALILTDAAKRAVAKRYLAANGPATSGEVGLEENTTAGAPGAEVRAGGKLTLTDATMNVTGLQARIVEIVKRFHDTTANTETWTVRFGSARPSAANYIRQLTRSVKG